MNEGMREGLLELLAEAGVAADGDAAHGFDSGCDDEIHVSGGDGLRGEVDGLLAGAAEAIDLDAGNFDGKSGLQGRDSSDAGALLSNGSDAAGDDVFDLRLIDSGFLDASVERLRE